MSAIQHVIVDRDGVLNEELNGGTYVTDPREFRWLPGALNALADLHASGIRVSVATNQSGIGRGLMSERDLEAVHQKMNSDATAAHASIAAIFYCPHSPDTACTCRKPAPGLIDAAVTESRIAPAHTLVVGDADRDLDAARSSGAHAALVRTGKGRLHESYAAARGIPVYDDLRTLVAHLLCENGCTKHSIESLQTVFSEHARVVAAAEAQLLPALAQCIETAHRCLNSGHKILVCGNGGSAADAQHFVAELVGRYTQSRSALSAIVLGSDSATVTAVSNDFGFEHVFARQIDALARPGDVLIALSTSGNSANVVHAATTARMRGCLVIALTGRSGGRLIEHADISLRVPSDTVARIQEVHELCLHALAQALEVRAT